MYRTSIPPAQSLVSISPVAADMSLRRLPDVQALLDKSDERLLRGLG